MKTGASAAAPPGQEWSPGSHHPRSPDWAPTRVELPGSVSTYLPSLARSTSGVWCPRVGDPRSGSSRHRSSARICRAPPAHARGQGEPDSGLDAVTLAATGAAPLPIDQQPRRLRVLTEVGVAAPSYPAQPPTTGLRRSGRAEATTVLPTITVVVRGVGGKHPAEMSLACRWARSGRSTRTAWRSSSPADTAPGILTTSIPADTNTASNEPANCPALSEEWKPATRSPS